MGLGGNGGNGGNCGNGSFSREAVGVGGNGGNGGNGSFSREAVGLGAKDDPAAARQPARALEEDGRLLLNNDVRSVDDEHHRIRRHPAPPEVDSFITSVTSFLHLLLPLQPPCLRRPM